jgi:Xaa-Pro aminopeptidase
MRKDIDRLLQQRGLGGLVVLAMDRYTPAMHYCTGQAIGHGIYLRGSDGRAHLVHDAMERDQAAKAGCDTSEFSQHGTVKLANEEPGPPEVMGRLIGELCAQLGIEGKVAFYGPVDLGTGWRVLHRALEVRPEIGIDRGAYDVLAEARTTKEPDELEAIRRAGKGSEAALARLRDYLRGLKPEGNYFRENGSGPVKLGDLRALLGEELLHHGALELAEAIVSQGRDAGVPHNRGNDTEPLRRGAPILVDIFPAPAGGGYHFDVTRTYCLGRPSDELHKLYEDVRDAFRQAMETLHGGEPCRAYQERTCDLFESRGHVTLRQNPGAHEGYIHGLGHGVGLDVHEAPRLGGPASNTQKLEPGMVVTVEPGLYYPSRGLGVRIEDLVAVRPDGGIENLAHIPYDLEIPIEG